MAQSPSSSPRLPSPPPMAEDQIGPTSPGGHGLEDIDESGQAATDYGAARRIRPGTRSEDMLEGPPLVEISEIDSAFQLTEHLKALSASLTHSSPAACTPIARSAARELSAPPPGVDRGIWLYELCRLLVTRANTMLVALFDDAPPCSASTCPEMRASEWQYLCAAHDPPKACCAIDYCCHTLDWAATQLTSSKLFPSRLALGGGGEGAPSPQHQLRKMTEIFRRVYRIFAHAWFSHRDVFWKVEGSTGLYVFFKTVCDEYRLIPEDSYTVPVEAEGGERALGAGDEDGREARRERGGERGGLVAAEEDKSKKDTTKRHHRGGLERQGSISTVIHEEVEEDDDDDDDDDSAVPERGEVVQLPSPPEERGAFAGGLQIREEVEVSVESAPTIMQPGPESGMKMEAQNETAVSAPAGASHLPKSPSSPTKGSSAGGGMVEAREEETAVAPMAPRESAAGKEDDATKTVAD